VTALSRIFPEVRTGQSGQVNPVARMKRGMHFERRHATFAYGDAPKLCARARAPISAARLSARRVYCSGQQELSSLSRNVWRSISRAFVSARAALRPCVKLKLCVIMQNGASRSLVRRMRLKQMRANSEPI